MALDASRLVFDGAANNLVAHTRNFAARKSQISSHSSFTFEDECFLEGLLSRAWQAWCQFWRDVVVASCLGTTNSAGQLVPGLAAATSESHVSEAARRSAPKVPRNPVWNGTNQLLRFEPTWGDPDVLSRIISRLQPSNATILLAAVSASSTGATALQTLRNAAAHHNPQTINDVHALLTTYSGFQVTHSTQAMFWTELASKDYVFAWAMGELKFASQAAVQ